jgi:hypothetical protein
MYTGTLIQELMAAVDRVEEQNERMNSVRELQLRIQLLMPTRANFGPMESILESGYVALAPTQPSTQAFQGVA